jgi:chemotaxis protein methyltransferase CheR
VTTSLASGGLDSFRTAVQRNLGLRFDDDARRHLETVLRRRIAATRLTCAGYLQLLETDPGRELTVLGSELTVGETYFLRHVEQFRALTETVVPERLRLRGGAGPLRLLSAGCASGEETYSLAIALRESAAAAVATSILGVDINPIALYRARAGRYTPWSLRAVPAEARRRWFTTEGADLVLNRSIRESVAFEWRNLAEDGDELWQPETYDVVFCRNVVMYFAPETMARVVQRLARTLMPGGYLFLGSAETLRGLSTDFQLCESDGAFYYRREGSRVPPPAVGWYDAIHSASERVHRLTQPPRTQASAVVLDDVPPAPRAAERRRPALDGVLELLRRERFTEALAAVDALNATGGDDPELLLLRAAALTHAARFQAAEQTCRRLLGIGQLNSCAHMLLALCREGKADLQGTTDQCRAAVLADPDFAMPHVHLARLARSAGDQETARREFAESRRLLPAETDRRILLFGGGFDREALISLCQAQSLSSGADL